MLVLNKQCIRAHTFGLERVACGEMYHNCINIFVQNPHCCLQSQMTTSVRNDFKSKSCNLKKLNYTKTRRKGFFFFFCGMSGAKCVSMTSVHFE